VTTDGFVSLAVRVNEEWSLPVSAEMTPIVVWQKNELVVRSIGCSIILLVRMPPLLQGRFVTRENRFLVDIRLPEGDVQAYLPNSGRLTELLVPGRLCYVASARSRGRKTHYDLKIVKYADTLVSVDAHLPNGLVAEALAARRLVPFQRYVNFDREVRLGDSRLDVRLRGPRGVCWVEVKSVSLVESGVARFPDAPTARGARHLRELSRAVQQGACAAIVFVVQRADACRFEPHDAADAVFGNALREATDSGVAVHSWVCRVSRAEVAIEHRIPVKLRSDGGIDAANCH